MCSLVLTKAQKCAYLSIIRSSPFVNSMPPGEEPEPQTRKRKRTIEPAPAADPQPQSQAKRRKRSRRSHNRPPLEFWDNLSRVPLCRCALREFDRRTIRPVTPKPPVRSILKDDLSNISSALLGTVVQMYISEQTPICLKIMVCEICEKRSATYISVPLSLISQNGNVDSAEIFGR